MRRPATVVALLGLLAACGGSPEPAADDDRAAARRVARFECPADAGAGGEPVPLDGRRLRVVTTVAPLTSIVSEVAGERADVRGLVPEGVNSHTYEPAPSVAAVLEQTDLLLGNGLQLEDPTHDLARERLPRRARIVELGTLTLPRDHYLFDDAFPRSAGRPNPHLWTNPPMAACYALVAARALSAADPAGADQYAANAAGFVDRADALDRAVEAATATVPRRHRALLTYHDAFAYTAARYGWRVIGAVQPASFEEPSPRDVARLIEQLEEAGVPAIFGSEVFPSPVLERIGEEAGVRYVDVLRDDDLPGGPGDPEHSWLGLMRFDFATIVRSLGGDATALDRLDVTRTAPDRAEYPQ